MTDHSKPAVVVGAGPGAALRKSRNPSGMGQPHGMPTTFRPTAGSWGKGRQSGFGQGGTACRAKTRGGA